jgi:hypothetical protein
MWRRWLGRRKESTSVEEDGEDKVAEGVESEEATETEGEDGMTRG